jgi:hypothetical protein
MVLTFQEMPNVGAEASRAGQDADEEEVHPQAGGGVLQTGNARGQMQTAIAPLPRWLYAVVLAAVVFHLAVGVAAFRWQRTDHRITGTMTLFNGGFITRADGQGCEGTSGYDDIDEGTQVTVTDGAGKTLGVGNLGIGRNESGSCSFEFSIPNVADADFYKIEVSHRGELSYSKKELVAKNWRVEVALGQ